MKATDEEMAWVKHLATEAINIRIVNNGNSFEWDEPQCPGVKFSSQRANRGKDEI
jgi:hypothetical protein